jgi:hypothetical protein
MPLPTELVTILLVASYKDPAPPEPVPSEKALAERAQKNFTQSRKEKADLEQGLTVATEISASP